MYKVGVALSGGVDSSVALGVLKQKGFEVFGVTMDLSSSVSEETKREFQKGDETVKDAKKICDFFEVPHYVLECGGEFKEKVVDEFEKGYFKGITPNPCVQCNKYIKFDCLFKETKKLGADFFATGHYANIEENEGGEYFLKAARDKRKDQSYFLYGIKKETLPEILFPLHNLTKNEVKDKAERFQLPVINKPFSQEVCFIASGDYRRFLKNRNKGSGKQIKEVSIKDSSCEVLGRHKGICFYTVGQRQGLNISAPRPLYVLEIKPAENEIIVGFSEETYRKELAASELNLFIDYPKQPFCCSVRIRYNAPLVEAKVYPEGSKDKLKVVFDEPQSAVSPGQSVVLYDGDTVLGGGIIERS